MRGIRIQNVVNELNGERIDVVQWDPEPSRFVANALSPAQVVSVDTRDAENTAEVVVPDRQLSLAIGKEGQNARLAAKLTGWRIDIKSQSAYEQELAEKGLTLEQVQAQQREEALERARAAAALAQEQRAAVAAAASTRALTPEEEMALQYAEQPEAVPAAAEVTETPVAPAPEPAAAGGPARPQIRFGEDLVRTPLEELKPGGGAQKKRGGPPGRRRTDEEEAARLAAQRNKKKGGARRILPEVEEDEDDEYADLIR
jgi:N utilization substance protein A